MEEIEEKFRMARSLGFDNINMDLIVGLPGEDKEKWRIRWKSGSAESGFPDRPFPCVKRATRLNLFKDNIRKSRLKTLPRS